MPRTARELRSRGARDHNGRLLAWLLGSVFVLAVLHAIQTSYYEGRLNTAVREVSGQPQLSMDCRSLWEEAMSTRHGPGWVTWGSTAAQLRIDVCHNAVRFSSDPTSERHRTGLMVVIHELAHLVGHRSEAETECVAMWAAPRLAVALGATHEEGVAAAQWHQDEVNPRLLPEYRATGCLAGDPPDSPLLP